MNFDFVLEYIILLSFIFLRLFLLDYVNSNFVIIKLYVIFIFLKIYIL